MIWIDDNPENNEEIVEEAKQQGIEIFELPSSFEAKKFLNDNSFDKNGVSVRIVTDMHRFEKGRSTPTAGMNLIQWLIKKKFDFPLLVFTSGYWVDKIAERWPYISATADADDCLSFASFEVEQPTLLEEYSTARGTSFIGKISVSSNQLSKKIEKHYPSHWKAFVERFATGVNPNTREGQYVTNIFRDALDKKESYKVSKITRIQDRGLWLKYMNKKRGLRKRFPSFEKDEGHEAINLLLASHPLATPILNEQLREAYLFFTTETDKMDIVNLIGFDERYSLKCGDFGKGIYFHDTLNAENIDKSGGEYRVLIARVLIGDCHYCKKYDKKAYLCSSKDQMPEPLLKANGKDVHDSIFAESKEFGGDFPSRVFVIYDGESAYPEYEIKFIRKKIEGK